MRIKAIRLSWFRGAADKVALEPNCRSMVVYGVNGSGKSSFVDAIEYVLNDGRIGHLAHEYSGKRQEKAVPNTHKPEGQKTDLSIEFCDGSELKVEAGNDGSPTSSSADAVGIRTWDYRRTVLRQDEVAAFIHNTKGGKYSALLPLLGLQRMEVAAENLRQLAKTVEEQSKLKETKSRLREIDGQREAIFGTDSNDEILTKINDLHAKYCTDKAATNDVSSRCMDLGIALDMRVAGSSADQRRHDALRDTAALKLKDNAAAVRAATGKLASALEPLIAEKLEVLQSASEFVSKVQSEKEVECPACGHFIAVESFQAHVTAERTRLRDIISTFEKRKEAMGTLCDTVKSLKVNLRKADLKSWRDQLEEKSCADNLSYLDEINPEALRASCGEEDLQAIEAKLLPLIDAAASGSEDAPPDVRQLSTDKRTCETGSAVIAAKEQVAMVARAEALVAFITSLEKGIREEIRFRSQRVIDDISADLRSMWAILHPGEAIEDVRLYLPSDADKAIDIRLKFHGVEQGSPRLTLSEGYRNSLGLCIFLAMAKREGEKDRPLFLDDVVVSMDRNHRGMIAELLEKEFSTRQVIVLTHDREWYAEVRQQLDSKRWAFKMLLPYETPATGIRWSHKTTTFDDARAHLKDRPDSAGNDARKIMDVELAFIAERLQIRLPYVRGDKNDKRMAHDFLERLVADGKKCFQKKSAKEYDVYTDGIEALRNADRLLTSWANRASHTFDLVTPEASKLIDACEHALECFSCSSCGTGVWLAQVDGGEWIQCQCGQIRWRYGKG